MKSFLTSGSVRTQAPLSREQVTSLTILGMLLRAPNAPLFMELLPDQDDIDPYETAKIILWKILRCLRQRPSDSIPPQGLVIGLSHLLAEVELNARSLLGGFATEAMADLIAAWKVTPTSSLNVREGLLVCIRIAFEGLLLVEGAASVGLPAELQKLCDGLEVRSVLSHLLVKPLNPKSLRFYLLADDLDLSTMTFRTFQHGFDFDAQQAFTWATLELHADVLFEVCRSYRLLELLPY
jgi:ataxia telangiectasia mutated family protein